MPLLNKTLTEREKAALYMHVFGGVDSWPLLYAIADTGNGEIDPAATGNKYPSRWKNTPKVQEYLKELQRRKYELLREEREKGIEEGKNLVLDSVHTKSEGREDVPKNGTSKFIDYSDPKAQTRKLNELVNSADDPGEALDALKVIISTQKADREAAKERKTVQYYRPIRCNQCPLYQKKAQKAKK